MTGRLAVLSGPGGVGKGTIIGALRPRLRDWVVTVSVTTRPPRPAERDGVDYHFVTDDEFDTLVADGAFLEWAAFGGNRYGTLWGSVREPLAAGAGVLLELDVQGALAVRKEFDDATLIFVHPPDTEALRARLRTRGTDDEARVAQRLALAEWELAQAGAFDEHVVNDDVADAVVQIVRILDAVRDAPPA